MTSPIVSTQWLAQHLESANLVLLDVSMDKVVGKEPLVYPFPVYIPHTQLLSLESQLLDTTSQQANSFPTAERFNSLMVELGISEESIVVIYDNQGIYSSPRAWWIFKTMGFNKVYILDGGLPQWLAQQRNTCNTTIVAPGGGTFTASFQASSLVSAAQVLAATENSEHRILDARSASRFSGDAKEPRAGLRAGHIPHAVNLPFGQVLAEHRFKSPQQIRQLLGELSLNPNHCLIFSCGSGITACILIAAATIAQYPNNALYDGSWAEWGANHQLPVEND